jgi:hypothetical protein
MVTLTMTESEYLRDLLYLDWEKAASIFSQLQGGLLRETQESAERARERRAGLGLSLGPLRPEIGGSAAERASVVETRVLHHDLLLAIEDALFTGGAAVDLASYGSAEEARAAAESSAYIRAEGWVAIEDNSRVDHFAGNFLDLIAIIRRSLMMGLEESPELQDLRARLEEQREAANTGTKGQKSAARRRGAELEAELDAVLAQLVEGEMPAPSAQTIDDIRKWIGVFSAERIIARFYPFEEEPGHHIVAPLKRDSFVDTDLGNLLVAYGARPTVKLTVFGLVTSVPAASGPPFDPMSEYPDSDDDDRREEESDEERAAGFERVFRGIFGAMDGMEQFARPTRYPRITIFPIAIYRRVPVAMPT